MVLFVNRCHGTQFAIVASSKMTSGVDGGGRWCTDEDTCSTTPVPCIPDDAKMHPLPITSTSFRSRTLLHTAHFDDESYSFSRIFNSYSFYYSGNSQSILNMINLSPTEFTELWSVVMDTVIYIWNVGRRGNLYTKEKKFSLSY